jgi:hypothetical protein
MGTPAGWLGESGSGLPQSKRKSGEWGILQSRFLLLRLIKKAA